jgi:hypothetical protein
LETVYSGGHRERRLCCNSENTTVDGAEQTAGESLDEREQRENQASGEQPEIRERVQQAIAALQTLDEAL